MAERNQSVDELADGPADPQPDVSFVVNTEALERITPDQPLNPKSGKTQDPSLTPDS